MLSTPYQHYIIASLSKYINFYAASLILQIKCTTALLRIRLRQLWCILSSGFHPSCNIRSISSHFSSP